MTGKVAELDLEIYRLLSWAPKQNVRKPVTPGILTNFWPKVFLFIDLISAKTRESEYFLETFHQDLCDVIFI